MTLHIAILQNWYKASKWSKEKKVWAKFNKSWVNFLKKHLVAVTLDFGFYHRPISNIEYIQYRSVVIISEEDGCSLDNY